MQNVAAQAKILAVREKGWRREQKCCWISQKNLKSYFLKVLYCPKVLNKITSSER